MTEPRRPNSLRLKGYDYALRGAYFVTICCEFKAPMLGVVHHDLVNLSPLGAMIDACWRNLPQQFPDVLLDAHIVMPEHFYALLVLTQHPDVTQPISLSTLIQRFKARTSNLYLKGLREGVWPDLGARVWQRGFNDRVIRNDYEFEQKRDYILTNPLRRWLKENASASSGPGADTLVRPY
jgi:putative transposase